jgi:hypothetical protein
LGLLQAFYKDADCEAFFKSEANYYEIAEQRFSGLFKKLDIEWYYNFYGKAPNEEFHTIIGLGNGSNNYGTHVDLPGKKREVHAVIAASTFDSTGMPVFEVDDYLPTLIHEFNHSFVNYLTEQYQKQLSSSGKVIFSKESAKMKKQHYHEWQTMMSEALVRASVIRYLINHKSDTLADKELKTQLSKGFVWMNEFVVLLAQYENERTQYSTLESFMPRIVSFYDTVASQIDIIDQHYLQRCAKVISVEPFTNHDTGISIGPTEIAFNFDKRLDGKRYFFGPGKDDQPYPKVLGARFSNDNKTIILKVELEPNTEYQINMHGSLMRTDDGYSVQNFTLTFKTEVR